MGARKGEGSGPREEGGSLLYKDEGGFTRWKKDEGTDPQEQMLSLGTVLTRTWKREGTCG